MTAALVGQASNQAFSTTCTVTRTTTTGNTLVLCIQHQGSTSVTVTDSAGGTWTLAATTNTAGSTAQRLASIYYRINAGAITSVTVTMGASSALNVSLSEYSGVGSFRAAAAANVASGSVQATVTATAADLEVSLAAWTAASRAETVTSGYTALTAVATSTTYLAEAYKLSSAGGTVGPTWSLSPTATAGVITAAFAPSSVPLTVDSVVATPSSGTAPLSVSAVVTASGGTGTAKTYAADWGDGSTTAAQSSATMTHTYSAGTAGTSVVRTITVTVANT